MPRIDQPVPISLDKDRSILFTQGALMESELLLTKIWGRRFNLLSVFDEGNEDNVGATEYLVMLWAGLLHEDPTLTFDQVRAFSAGKTQEIITQVVEAWRAVYQTEDVESAASEVGETDPTIDSTGPDSGLSPESTSTLEAMSSGV